MVHQHPEHPGAPGLRLGGKCVTGAGPCQWGGRWTDQSVNVIWHDYPGVEGNVLMMATDTDPLSRGHLPGIREYQFTLH